MCHLGVAHQINKKRENYESLDSTVNSYEIIKYFANYLSIIKQKVIKRGNFIIDLKKDEIFVDKIRAKINSENELLGNIFVESFNEMFSEFYSSIEESIESLEKSLNNKWIEYPNEEVFQTFLNNEIYFRFKYDLTKHFDKYFIKFEDKIYSKTFRSIDEKYKPKDVIKEEFVIESIAEEVDNGLIDNNIVMNEVMVNYKMV